MRLRLSPQEIFVVAVKWLVGLSLALAALWSAWVAYAWDGVVWSRLAALFLLALVIGLAEPEQWAWLESRTRVSALLLRLLTVPLLCALLAVGVPLDAPGYIFVLLAFFVFNLLLLGLGLLFRRRVWGSLANLGIILLSLATTLLALELVIAPVVTRALQDSQRRAAQQQAAERATAPLASVDGQATSPTTPSTALTEFVGQPGPGPAWGPLTGWGTNTQTTVHSWMEGVYDVTVEYNALGFRGPEIAYDKPDDVYRILLLGDSYIEALQVEYEDTVYAQLGEMLKDRRTPDGKRFQVFGVGATGWGTLQAYLYYHHEGCKFQPDLIIDFFVMNDVADNNPAHFYHDRSLDFQIDGDTVQVIQGAAQQTEPSSTPGQRWLEALPPMLQKTATAALIRQWLAPPRLVVGLGGQLQTVHPQNYIYVSYPEIDGYEEGWRRTQRAYEIWAQEAESSGAQLWVVPVDISAEKITELSTYFRDSTADWIWDIDLPLKRLRAILDPLAVPLIPTREYYAQYAHSVGQRPFDALFYTQDWHWNPAGHRVTAQLLAETLRNRGIVAG